MSKSGDQRPSRFGVFGDLPTRLLVHYLGGVPWFLEPVLLTWWVAIFFGVAKSQRRAVVSNLRALHPHWGWLRSRVAAWGVFYQFGATYVDALRCEAGGAAVDWVVEGEANFRELAQRQEGCLLLTAHMGNYDLAARLFSSRFDKPMYSVRAPERHPQMQELREAKQRAFEQRHPMFRTLYNRGAGYLGVELARLLREGAVVAVQGDRVVFDVSSMEVEMPDGLVFQLPRGPLVMKQISDAPVYPLFVLRDGWRRYRIKVLPELVMPPRRRGASHDAEVRWAAVLLDAIKSNWDQWFVFEPLLRRRRETANPTN